MQNTTACFWQANNADASVNKAGIVVSIFTDTLDSLSFWHILWACQPEMGH